MLRIRMVLKLSPTLCQIIFRPNTYGLKKRLLRLKDQRQGHVSTFMMVEVRAVSYLQIIGYQYFAVPPGLELQMVSGTYISLIPVSQISIGTILKLRRTLRRRFASGLTLALMVSGSM